MAPPDKAALRQAELDDDDAGVPAPGGAKRAWQAPRIRTGHLFESNSLACGKNTPALDQCIQNPVSS